MKQSIFIDMANDELEIDFIEYNDSHGIWLRQAELCEERATSFIKETELVFDVDTAVLIAEKILEAARKAKRKNG